MNSIISQEAKDLGEYLIKHGDELMDAFCAHVAEGGSPVKFARQHKIRYGVLMNWIHKDKEREKLYVRALNDRAEWTQEMVLDEFRQLAFSDIREMFDKDGRIKYPTEWPDRVASAIKSIKIDALYEGVGRERTRVGDVHTVHFHNKVDALKTLGEQSGLLEKTKIEIGETLTELILKSYEIKDVTDSAKQGAINVEANSERHDTDTAVGGPQTDNGNDETN